MQTVQYGCGKVAGSEEGQLRKVEYTGLAGSGIIGEGTRIGRTV